MAIPIWKLTLQPASFNGVLFHVEAGVRSGGRRLANHEYPKRETPFAEDMGRRQKQFVVVGYVIGPDYETRRDALMAQLDLEVNGPLILPTSTDQKIVCCDRYSITERRERGGYAEFDMVFFEAGKDPSLETISNTASTVRTTANAVTGGPSFTSTATTFMNSSDITSIH